MEGSLGRFDGIIERQGGAPLRRCYQEQVERAIRNAKRTAWDKWFRRQFCRAIAQRDDRRSCP